MPIYEYECADCGKQFEAFQSISDKPLKKCQFCQGTVRRLISSSSFSLKGGGWYKDGYSKPSPEKKAPTAKGPEKAPEVKPATKPAEKAPKAP